MMQLFIFFLSPREQLSSESSFLSPALFNLQVECPFGEGNGTPLQYSCLENPMDGGAW